MTTIDFYVTIIDNYGDIGFALNLALIMAGKDQNLKVRFFSDNKDLFKKMIKGGNTEITNWFKTGQITFYNLENLDKYTPCKNIFTFFDYRLPKEYLQKGELGKNIIQFGYFLLHKGIENLHGTSYEIDGNKITHFIPSLLPKTGGIIINKNNILKTKEDFIIYLNSKYSLSFSEEIKNKKWISIFVYKNTSKKIIDELKNRENNEVFFIFDSKDAKKIESENIFYMPFLELLDYNQFLSFCDANIVRGENSLCTSLSYGKATLWDIYKEKNGAHNEKIKDFINFLLKFNDFSLIYNSALNNFNGIDSSKSLNVFLDNFESNINLFKNIGIHINKNCNLYNNLNNILCD